MNLLNKIFKRKKVRFIALLFREQHGTLVVHKHKQIELKDVVELENKKYVINKDKPSFVNGNNVYYCINESDGSTMSFKKIETSVSPEDLDLIMGQNIISELTKGVMDNKKDQFMLVFLGFIFGALIVGLILTMYYSGRIQDILMNTPQPEIPEIPLM
jgi:hypothetical protein